MRSISRVMIIAAGGGAPPFFSSAATVEELGAQIQYLLQQIQALQAQLGSTPVSQTPATNLTQNSSCPQLARALGLGAQGDDVLQLQTFLVAQEVLGEDSVIGYFGPRTEAAVKHWQASQGIVFTGTPATTGFGVVGFRTRTAIAAVCNKAYTPVTPYIQQCPLAPRPNIACLGSWSASTDMRGCTTSWRCSISAPDPTQPNACSAIALQCPTGTQDQVGANCSHSCVPITTTSNTLSVSPSSGQAPLTATLSGTALNAQYSLDFGDGTPTFSTSCSNGCGQLTNVQQTHTYTSTGTYIAKLTSYNQPAAPYYVTATAVITVGGSSGSPSISVNTVSSSVVQGNTLDIAWQVQNEPDVAHALITLGLYTPGGAYIGDISTEGGYLSNTIHWTGRTTQPNTACSGFVCGDLAPPGTYIVRATLRHSAGGTTIASAQSASFTITNNSTSASISVSESPSTVALGQNVAVSWNSQNAPSNSAVALYLVQTSGKSEGVIGSGKTTSGNVNWTIPSTDIGCPDCPTLQSRPPAGTYVITASIYTPINAWISGYPPANPTYPTFWATASSSPFTITQ